MGGRGCPLMLESIFAEETKGWGQDCGGRKSLSGVKGETSSGSLRAKATTFRKNNCSDYCDTIMHITESIIYPYIHSSPSKKLGLARTNFTSGPSESGRAGAPHAAGSGRQNKISLVRLFLSNSCPDLVRFWSASS